MPETPTTHRDVTVRFPAEGYAIIEAFAKKREKSVPDFVNEAINFWVSIQVEKRLGFSDLLVADPVSKKMKLIEVDK